VGTAPAAAADGATVAVTSSATSDSAGLRRIWPDVLEQVKQRSRRTHALLDHASITEVEGTLIRLGVSSAPIAKMISDDKNLSLLRDALISVVGGGWQIEVSPVASTPAGQPDVLPSAESPPAGDGERNGGGPARQPDAARPARPVRPARPLLGERAMPAEPPPEDYGVDEESDDREGHGGGSVDPEAAAMELLKSSLGARPMDS
jgi:DNA polymerase-3 subunit gamma/tau